MHRFFTGSVVTAAGVILAAGLATPGAQAPSRMDADALFKAEGWDPDGAEARKFRSSVREAFVRHMGGTEIDARQRSSVPSSTFTWNDLVETIEEAPTRLRPGSRAWVVGISAPHERSGSFLAEHPTGFVYTIEFEDGSSVEAGEAMLRPDSNVR